MTSSWLWLNLIWITEWNSVGNNIGAIINPFVALNTFIVDGGRKRLSTQQATAQLFLMMIKSSQWQPSRFTKISFRQTLFINHAIIMDHSDMKYSRDSFQSASWCNARFYVQLPLRWELCFLKIETHNQPHAICTVKPVCNDHLYNKIYYPWFIQ